MPKYYIGVDGGGTNCRIRLTDADLNVLAEATTRKSSNLQVRGGNAAYEAVTELTAAVFAKAGLDISEAEHAAACFGMAGARMKSARQAFQERDFPFENLVVYDDIDIARAGAHGEGDGGVMIIGTGSAAMALVDGKRHQSGGWGFFIGDTMAGAILGRELLRRSLIAHDGLIPKTPLTEAVMARFGNDGDRLMAWSFDNEDARAAVEATLPDGVKPTHPVPARPVDYGGFTLLFTEYLAKGDPLAAELLEFELDAIAEYVDWFRSIGTRSIAIVGGFGHSIMAHIRARFGDIIVEEEPVSLTGAIILARQHFGK
ncbi:MAG: hypothetical protein KKH72_11595 [Alphaproteobacteria bacterium]|nr:hypothetical protein [Alphaproteobacteria bacterium]